MSSLIAPTLSPPRVNTWADLSALIHVPTAGRLAEPAPKARRASLKAKPQRLSANTAYEIVKQGISSKALEPLSVYLGLQKGQVAEYLDLDRTTATRRAKNDQPLPTHAAEGVLRLLELDQMAGEAFETHDEASAWLRRPHPMLGGEAPLAAAKTSYGAERVKEILVALKYGGVV